MFLNQFSWRRGGEYDICAWFLYASHVVVFSIVDDCVVHFLINLWLLSCNNVCAANEYNRPAEYHIRETPSQNSKYVSPIFLSFNLCCYDVEVMYLRAPVFWSWILYLSYLCCSILFNFYSPTAQYHIHDRSCCILEFLTFYDIREYHIHIIPVFFLFHYILLWS